MIDPDNNYEVIDKVFIDEGVILIGVTRRNIHSIYIHLANNCEVCDKMFEELKKAEAITKMTKEPIFFGIIKVSSISEMEKSLKVDKIPSLIAIK